MIDISSEENNTESEELQVPFLQVDIENSLDKRIAQLETEFEKIVPEQEEIRDLIDTEAAEATPLEKSKGIGSSYKNKNSQYFPKLT